MPKVIEFPADKIARGTHIYTPEMGQRKPNCQMTASLSHYGNHYFVDTKIELKGRGITLIKTYKKRRLNPVWSTLSWLPSIQSNCCRI